MQGPVFLDFGCAVIAGLPELGFPLAVKVFIDRLLPGRDWGLIAGRGGPVDAQLLSCDRHYFKLYGA
jgi:hypothetical protein